MAGADTGNVQRAQDVDVENLAVQRLTVAFKRRGRKDPGGIDDCPQRSLAVQSGVDSAGQFAFAGDVSDHWREQLAARLLARSDIYSNHMPAFVLEALRDSLAHTRRGAGNDDAGVKCVVHNEGSSQANWATGGAGCKASSRTSNWLWVS